MKFKFVFAFVLLAMISFTSFAQQVAPQEGQKLISPGKAFFVPHWWLKAQAGAAYDVGEAPFSHLISPNLQLSTGFQISELFAVRGSVSGIWAKNEYAYPNAKYKWNYVQPTIGAELDLTTLFLGSNPERSTHTFIYLGGGVAYSWGNDDAEKASKIYGVGMEKLWSSSRWNPVIKAGVGVDYNVTDNIAIGAEVNANMLPDHFNSKRGKNDNRDWHFNALIGVKFHFGRTNGRTEAIYEAPPLQAKKPDTLFVDVPIEKISFNVNIYFIINRSDIRTNQMEKLQRLIAYLDKHPKAFVRLSGYADRDTGTPQINMRLSRERANAVSQYLREAGIEEWRIRRFAKGDRVQPFEKPSDNRVCICYVYDPEHPERIDNWY
jgi:outer membrane protein OmpA-like peptidoglycan-associated protein